MAAAYLEQGRTWTFACALDWPGWARRGKGDEADAVRRFAWHVLDHAWEIEDKRPVGGTGPRAT